MPHRIGVCVKSFCLYETATTRMPAAASERGPRLDISINIYSIASLVPRPTTRVSQDGTHTRNSIPSSAAITAAVRLALASSLANSVNGGRARRSRARSRAWASPSSPRRHSRAGLVSSRTRIACLISVSVVDMRVPWTSSGTILRWMDVHNSHHHRRSHRHAARRPTDAGRPATRTVCRARGYVSAGARLHLELRPRPPTHLDQGTPT